MSEHNENEPRILDHRVAHHPPSNEAVAQAHDFSRVEYDALIGYLNKFPPSREVSLALTNLEQSLFWLNAAIARQQISLHELT